MHNYNPNIIREIKSKRVRWVGHVASIPGDMRNAYTILVTLNGRDHMGDPCSNRKTILKLILEKEVVRVQRGFISCDYSNLSSTNSSNLLTS
jgi:hypothetical protein